MNAAIYAGSFDPFTFGHLAVALSASKIFSNLFVVVAINPMKTCMFSPEERVNLIKDTLSSFPELNKNIEVMLFNGYIVDLAGKLHANFLVRGIRGESDVKFEMDISELNSALCSDVQTIFIPGNRALSSVSSSQVKEKFYAGEQIDFYCPPNVIKAMRDRACT